MIVEGKMWWTLAILLIHSAKISWCGGGSSNGKVGYVRCCREEVDRSFASLWLVFHNSIVGFSFIDSYN